MTAVVQQTRLNWLLPASGFLAVVALLLVIAIGVSVALIIACVCVIFGGVLVLATLATKLLGVQAEPIWLFFGAIAAFMTAHRLGWDAGALELAFKASLTMNVGR